MALFKYSKYSFFLVLILASTDHPRQLESKVSLLCSTSKAKKLFDSLVGVYKRNIKKQGCFYCDESISCQNKINVKNRIKIANNSYENFVTVCSL